MSSAVSRITPQVRCSEDTKAGERCRNSAVAGTTLCVTHGGNSPSQRAQSRLRLLDLIDPAISTLDTIMRNPAERAADRIKAADSLLDRAGVSRKADIDIEDARTVLLERLLAMKANEALELSAAPAVSSNDDTDELSANDDIVVGELVL